MILRWWNPISWLAVPVVAAAQAVRGLFPWTLDGRRTALYVAVLGAGPALCLIVIWTMNAALAYKLFATFSNIAYVVAASLLIIVSAIGVGTGLNIFAKAGKDGAQFSAGSDDQDEVIATANKVADAAKEGAAKIEEIVHASPPAEPKDELDLQGAQVDQLEEFRREQGEEQK